MSSSPIVGYGMKAWCGWLGRWCVCQLHLQGPINLGPGAGIG